MHCLMHASPDLATPFGSDNDLYPATFRNKEVSRLSRTTSHYAVDDLNTWMPLFGIASTP